MARAARAADATARRVLAASGPARQPAPAGIEPSTAQSSGLVTRLCESLEPIFAGADVRTEVYKTRGKPPADYLQAPTRGQQGEYATPLATLRLGTRDADRRGCDVTRLHYVQLFLQKLTRDTETRKQRRVRDVLLRAHGGAGRFDYNELVARHDDAAAQPPDAGAASCRPPPAAALPPTARYVRANLHD